MSNSLKTLISKLNDNCRRAAERAAAICMSKGQYEVDVEHLFLALLEPRWPPKLPHVWPLKLLHLAGVN